MFLLAGLALESALANEPPDMPKKKSTAKPARRTAAKPAAASRSAVNEVDAFLRELDHPLKPALERVRSVILGVDPAIAEGIKWNSPSFRTSEYFATASIRKDFIRVVLHLGAKVKDDSTSGMSIADPTGLLEWHAKDRCSVKFRDAAGVVAGQRAFASIVRQWIAYVR